MSKFIHLYQRRNQFLANHGRWVFWSHGSRQSGGVADVGDAGVDVVIGFSDAWLPFYQRRCGQVAEGTKVHVS